jgi:hypothetical protein
MYSVQNDVHQLVQALLEGVPQSLRDNLALRFALCLHYANPNDSHELLTVDAHDVVAVSRKSANAFFDIPRFLQTIGELALEGTSMYQAPFLFVPIALRMMRIAREVVSHRQTASSSHSTQPQHWAVIYRNCLPTHGRPSGLLVCRRRMTMS